MSGFDKERVLETILKEAPILSNRREVISVGGDKEKKKVTIYAYYENRGVPDTELKYDRKKNPITTTSKSTLCEIYSSWRNKLGEYSGPFVGHPSCINPLLT